jgi:hypothetical protein
MYFAYTLDFLIYKNVIAVRYVQNPLFFKIIVYLKMYDVRDTEFSVCWQVCFNVQQQN